MNTQESLKSINLNYLYHNLNHFLNEVKEMNPLEIIETLIEKELDFKKKKSLERRLKSSKIDISQLKGMDQFDWSWPEKLDRSLIEDLFTLDFIKYSKNIVLSGSVGTGKTMIAKNIGRESIYKGFTVLFTDASSMINKLSEADSPRLLSLYLKRFVSPNILIIDELGYQSYSDSAADLLFKVISSRYEKSSTIITTNIEFKEWENVFSGASCVGAMIDRIVHHSEIITINGGSYRLKEANDKKRKKK